MQKPKQTPEQLILLSEAVILTGRHESTIRRFFKKPENKPYTQTKGGKVYVDKAVLLKHYKTPGTPEQAPEQSTPTVDATLQALINQLEVKDRQIANLSERLKDANERLKESNINHNIALQKLQLQQTNLQQEDVAEQTKAPEPPRQTPVTSEQTPEQRPRSWFARLFS